MTTEQMSELVRAGLTMEEFFSKVSRVEYPDIGEGHFRSINDVYTQVVSRNRIEPAVMNDWWRLLSNYVQREDCIVFIRKYGNERPRSNQRRGFYSKCPNGFGYVYCDNKLAHYFYTMARVGFVPDIDNFARVIRNRIMPYGPGGTREERELQAYSSGPTTMINSSGWYLPHIFSADNPHDYTPEYLQSRQLFDRGVREQWCRLNGDEYYVRDVRNFSDEERQIFVAHFLRLVNPMNYFLMPWQRWQRTLVDGRIIGSGLGEFGAFIDYMRLKRRSDPAIAEAFGEFEDKIMCLPYGGEVDLDMLGRREVDYEFSHGEKEMRHHANVGNRPVGVARFTVTYGGTTAHCDSMLDVVSWVVNRYVVDNPGADVARIRATFKPQRMFKALADAQREANWQRQYPREPIACANNEQLVVNRNWYNKPNGNWPRFLASAGAVGFIIR